MVEVLLQKLPLDLPYMIRVYDVSEERFDEIADEDTKVELLDGVMIVHSPASMQHDDISAFVRSLMHCYAKRKRLGRAFGPDSLVHLAACRKFAPDIYFVETGRVPQPLPQEFEGTPDLIVEILSPSNRDFDLEEKRPAYRKAGVREIWFVDPQDQECQIDRKQKRGYKTTQAGRGRVTSTVLPGFWLDLAWLWADERPDVFDCLAQILA